MTVPSPVIEAILARLDTIEARQNLLKNHLLSLKQQVQQLQRTVQGNGKHQGQTQRVAQQLMTLEDNYFGDGIQKQNFANLDDILAGDDLALLGLSDAELMANLGMEELQLNETDILELGTDLDLVDLDLPDLAAEPLALDLEMAIATAPSDPVTSSQTGGTIGLSAPTPKESAVDLETTTPASSPIMEPAVSQNTVTETVPSLPPTSLTTEDFLNQCAQGQTHFAQVQLLGLVVPEQDLQGHIFDGSHCQGSNFQGADLRDSSFQGCNLQGCDFRGASLERVKFTGADCTGAQCQGIFLNSQTTFAGANLQGADFSDVNFRGLKLAGWDLTGAKLVRANFIGADLRETVLNQADFTGAVYSTSTQFPEGFTPEGGICLTTAAQLENVDLQGVDLRRLDLTGVNLRGANLADAVLVDCDLSNGDLQGADLRRSHLRATCLETNFTGADLREADLRDGNFTASQFQGANFQGATLKDANFTATDVRGANFQDSDTYRTNFNGANLRGLNLVGINFEGDMSGADLSGANLQGVNLNYLDLSWANLTDADVTGATFKETNLDNANLRGARGFNLQTYPYKVYVNNTVMPDGKTCD
ncbi:MAG: pentapeptide repeat-containing protein [Synechococcus sp.]|nr:pentapeptide repeat-containing protein [Synechococcus sp.]